MSVRRIYAATKAFNFKSSWELATHKKTLI